MSIDNMAFPFRLASLNHPALGHKAPHFYRVASGRIFSSLGSAVKAGPGGSESALWANLACYAEPRVERLRPERGADFSAVQRLDPRDFAPPAS
ncbi:MAG TPA: hypothetical protein VIK18_13315 [Pirellulales bacterium]